MIFQACFDDTGSRTTQKERLFMLGGLVADVPNWERFSEAWDEELGREPKLDYFKLSQALAMRDQFAKERGWTEEERDRRVLRFAQLAAAHAEMGVAIWVREDVYKELVVPFARHHHLKSPYFTLFHHITEVVSRHVTQLPDCCELKYVFDDQGVIGRRAQAFWDSIKARTGGAILGSTPSMEDDKKFLPLQAADLYAGISRADVEGRRTTLIEDAIRLFNRMKQQSIGAEYTREHMLSTAALLVVTGARR